MEDLEAAITVAMDPLASSQFKERANLFCTQIKESHQSYQLCLSGYLDTSR